MPPKKSLKDYVHNRVGCFPLQIASLSAGRAVSLLAALRCLTCHANPAGVSHLPFQTTYRAAASDVMAEFPF